MFGSGPTAVSAVNDISFRINEGENIGIVGESGSGKSATALAIMRLISPPGRVTTGKAVLRVESPVDLFLLPEKEMLNYRGSKLSMIFQEPMTSLNPVFTCGSQVAESLRWHLKLNTKQAKETVMEWFEEAGLADKKRIYHAYPHQLSGGQKQRVMIASAMCCNPSLLIADEPTTALDTTVQARILELMASLKAKYRMAMLFITHDLNVIAGIADRILVMYKGRIIEQGSTKEILTNPRHPYTQALLACRPSPSKRKSRLPVTSDFMAELPADLSADSHGMVATINPVQRLPIDYSSKPFLTVSNLSVTFPVRKSLIAKTPKPVTAVDHVSFSIYKGEVLGLVGESGSGKSTLSRALLQLIHPDSGEVFVEGTRLKTEDADAMRRNRKHLQIIFQDPYSSLNPRLPIGFALMEPMKVHGIHSTERERKERTMELLHKVNLPHDALFRYPHEFSAGQRQRICIARALTLNPRFLICDECVSALDVSVQAQILNLLLQLRDEFQLTYLFISHDLSVVQFMSDRIAVMKDGRIEEIGAAEQICTNPQSAYTRNLIAAMPSFMHVVR